MNKEQMSHYAAMTIGFAKSRILLKKVLDDNYDLKNTHEIAPKLRNEIEDFLKIHSV